MLPAPVNINNNIETPLENIATVVAPAEEVAAPKNPLLYAAIAGLAILLLLVIFWGITLQKRIRHLTELPSKPHADKPTAHLDKQAKLPNESSSKQKNYSKATPQSATKGKKRKAARSQSYIAASYLCEYRGREWQCRHFDRVTSCRSYLWGSLQ